MFAVSMSAESGGAVGADVVFALDGLIGAFDANNEVDEGCFGTDVLGWAKDASLAGSAGAADCSPGMKGE